MHSNYKTLTFVFLLGVSIRWALVNSQYRQNIQDRIEITTPLNSIKRVIEGHYRASLGINPYDSDILHESPIHLKFYSFLIRILGENLPLAFILADIVTAVGLYLFSKRYMLQLFIEQEIEKHTYAKDSVNQLLKGNDLSLPPLYTVIVFLLNPYTIFNCVACTTSTFSNLVMTWFLVGTIYNNWLLSIVTLALSAFQSFYPLVLLSPLYLSFYKGTKSVFKASLVVFAALLAISGLMVLSKEINGGWKFLDETFGFILQVNDQQPNVGVFWYFFMEMFEHFRLLFLWSYQMNVTILYLVPLSIKFRRDPSLLAACFISVITIFKSYPSIGDFALTLALLPSWKHLYNCMQQILISCVTIVVTTILAPILWDLWIYWGTANANFFFGATLAFVTAHIFIVTDISFAYSKREYLLKFGNCRKINGKDAKLVLE